MISANFSSYVMCVLNRGNVRCWWHDQASDFVHCTWQSLPQREYCCHLFGIPILPTLFDR